MDFQILPQPDDVTCGPTCLHAVYRYLGDDADIGDVIREIQSLEPSGTLAVFLANHALRRGYRATIYTYNLEVFDPTWFRPGIDIVAKLREQAAVKPGPRLQAATPAYIEFLERGGVLRYEDLSLDLVRTILLAGHPILTGLSATYLYRCAREVEAGGRLHYDDILGRPTGHFVVLRGWEPDTERIRIADPLHDNPGFEGPHYLAAADRVLSAILLGALTYDANFLVLEAPAAGRYAASTGS